MSEPMPTPLPPDPRRDQLLEGIPRTARLVEIGASFRPLVPKRDGWNTCVVDHDTREGLLAKYARAAIDPESIEEVDVIISAPHWYRPSPRQTNSSVIFTPRVSV